MERIIIRSRDFNLTKLNFGDIKTTKVGAQIVPVTYEGKRLYLQTPEMLVPFGASKYEDKDDPKKTENNNNWNLNLSFVGEDENPDIKALREKLDALSDHLVDVAYDNKWIKNKKGGKVRNESASKETIEQLLSAQVKYSDKVDENGKPKYAPTMRVKLPYTQESGFTCELYDETKQRLDDVPANEVLTKGSRARCLLECSAVYVGTSISLTWRLSQAQIRKSTKLTGFNFLADGDEEVEETSNSSSDSGSQVQMLEDTDDESTPEPEPQAEPEDEDEDKDKDKDKDVDEDDEEDAEVVMTKPKRRRARN